MDRDELFQVISDEMTDQFEAVFQAIHKGLGINSDLACWIVDAGRTVVEGHLMRLALDRPEMFEVDPALTGDRLGLDDDVAGRD